MKLAMLGCGHIVSPNQLTILINLSHKALQGYFFSEIIHEVDLLNNIGIRISKFLYKLTKETFIQNMMNIYYIHQLRT